MTKRERGRERESVCKIMSKITDNSEVMQISKCKHREHLKRSRTQVRIQKPTTKKKQE